MQDNALEASAHIDASRLLESIETLARFGARDDGGVNRPALSPADIDARRHLIERAIALGCTVRADACANLFFRREGLEDLAPVMTGSHIDTQPTGGKLDGCYGVLAGFECLAALNDAGIQTRRPLEVVAWTNEEGTRFQPGAMGSSAFVNPGLLTRYRDAKDSNGITLAAALSAHREAFPLLETRPAENQAAHAFIELHIEQGPLLELADVPLGVVTGIQGVRWYAVRCEGIAAHAGTTPMHARHDAMTLAVAVRAQIEAFAHKLGGDDTRITFGRWTVLPNSINTIASEVTFTIDFRHPDTTVLDAFDRELADCTARHAVTTEALFVHPPVDFAPAVIQRVADACHALGVPSLSITSGAFHDAMYLAKHCPGAMLFVPSRGGISHNPLEATDDHHLVLGTRALAHCLVHLCNEAP
jgi:N-carbamoyl-L-amino-acid hydrolase